MKATLKAINQMLAAGVIGNYAIGGAVGAIFYLAPAATVDLDVFVILPGKGGLLVTLSPIYDFLRARRARVEDEYIVVDSWPVRFLVPANALEEDAVSQAFSTEVDGIPTCVMAAEHLVAIALNTGRAKDHGRILQFLEQQAVDQNKLGIVLEHYGLAAKWTAFKKRFLGGKNE
jgi:hypothetical protein